MNIKILDLILLLTGGAIGTLLRYQITNSPLFCLQLKINIMLVNIIGSFIIGAFFALAQKYNLGQHYILFFATGFCGALTTMSSCVLESVQLLLNNKWLLGFSSLFLNLFLSLSAVWLGIVITTYSFHSFK